MTTYNTGNPVGSAAAKDLYDNAENIDRAVNGTGKTWTDRLGQTRVSMKGVEEAVPDAIAARDAGDAKGTAEGGVARAVEALFKARDKQQAPEKPSGREVK